MSGAPGSRQEAGRSTQQGGHAGNSRPANFDAVIFDMDGVLLDSEPIHFAALNDMLATEGVAIPQEENEQLLGTTVDDTFRWIMSRFGLSQPVESYMQLYDEKILLRLSGELEPSAGLLSLLDGIESRGLPLATCLLLKPQLG